MYQFTRRGPTVLVDCCGQCSVKFALGFKTHNRVSNLFFYDSNRFFLAAYQNIKNASVNILLFLVCKKTSPLGISRIEPKTAPTAY